MTTYYLTKYALGRNGLIPACEGEPSPFSDLGYIRLNGKPGSFMLGRDVFESPEEAIAAAQVMRDKKTASLERQIAKLRKMTFILKVQP
jgi:hypothetical protein